MIDIYTKTTLTIIAVFLFFMVFIKPYFGAEAIAYRNVTDVNIVSVGGTNVYGKIPVKVK